MAEVKKEYVLRIVWSKDKDEIDHLSEAYSDCDRVKFEVEGNVIEPPEDMQKLLRVISSDTLGIC